MSMQPRVISSVFGLLTIEQAAKEFDFKVSTVHTRPCDY